ncbi:hypothetical protein A3B51_00625 [Candidatus Curtissbacteria bacterium RIFCSPLOWO2_01_FULL_41_18]|uniref:Glycosyl transferase family 1 domain-containing protein n=1 Tax=Candidatus Curtissbacteria bacterium RIFCSPLOWO2_01_FULL_41_18 TaxID=1797727 RepID=A0A1F5HI18_9BACT|nr:MAG: hypothetical protein A3B51_00625 [Candidatus Curtissbacteria bacterium RIFCSPLOWO2_01_FULL_41_18]
MKILLITEFFPTGKNLKFSGGVEARTFFIAKYLAEKHEVAVLAARLNGTPAKEKMFGFTIFRIGPKRDYTATVGNILMRIKFIKNAIDFGKSLDADIIDGGNYICHFIAKQISIYKKIPAVAWYPDIWLNAWIKNTGFYGLIGEFLERLNLSQGFDAYIAISKETANKLKKYANNGLQVIPCGIDQKEFALTSKKFNNPTIICVSRLIKYKNLKTLIFAFAHLNTMLPTSRLIIIGSGPEEKSLKNLAKSLNISSKVKFLSNLTRSQLISLYKSSHVFCLPSLVEGFGIATIEAAAAGLPYVNSDIPIQKEVTRNGQGGFLVDPKKPLAFSQKFYKLLTKPHLYQEKSTQAKHLSANYQWQVIAQKTESVYSTIIR